MSSESQKRVVHSAPKSIPIIYDSPDPLTIANIANWEYSAVNCAQVNKDKIADDVLIPTLATGFQDELVCNWYDTNREDLSALSIAELAMAMRAEFLDEHWVLDLRTKILADYQPASESLSIWSTRLRKEALYLSKLTFTIADDRLLDHLETHLKPPSTECIQERQGHSQGSRYQKVDRCDGHSGISGCWPLPGICRFQ